LVRLALEAGVLVRTDRLLDEVWAAEAATTRRNTLQSKIAVDALVVLDDAIAASRLLEEGDAQARRTWPRRRCRATPVDRCAP